MNSSGQSPPSSRGRLVVVLVAWSAMAAGAWLAIDQGSLGFAFLGAGAASMFTGAFLLRWPDWAGGMLGWSSGGTLLSGAGYLGGGLCMLHVISGPFYVVTACLSLASLVAALPIQRRHRPQRPRELFE